MKPQPNANAGERIDEVDVGLLVISTNVKRAHEHRDCKRTQADFYIKTLHRDIKSVLEQDVVADKRLIRCAE